MKPTIPWLKQAFNYYNTKYFGGKLMMPSFSLRCSDNNWGFYKPNGTFNKLTRRVALNGPGILFLNGNYSREEKDWVGTLLHEMIHMYINTVMLLYPSNPHGKEFYQLAQKINEDGWEISEKNEKKNTDIISGNDEDNIEYNNRIVKPYLFCIIDEPNGKNYKYWGFKGDYNTLPQYIATAKKLKQFGAKSVTIYYCYSNNLGSLNSSPQTLDGIGANSIEELIQKLSTLIKEPLKFDNFKQYKIINL